MVFQQTGGTGYYVTIAQLGQVTGAQVYGRQEFPVGPVYAVRVNHQYGAVDWYIGFNRATNVIEYIASQAAPVGQPLPQVQTPPPPPSTSPVSTPAPAAPAVQAPPAAKSGEGCDLYPTMCK